MCLNIELLCVRCGQQIKAYLKPCKKGDCEAPKSATRYDFKPPCINCRKKHVLRQKVGDLARKLTRKAPKEGTAEEGKGGGEHLQEWEK